MTEKIINSIPAFRMIASDKSLKSATFWRTKEVSADLNSKVNLKLSENELDKINEIEYRNKIRNAHLIFIDGLGYIAFADSPGELEQIKSDNNSGKTKIKGRVKNRVFIITGGAQGFGAGIAEEIFAEGGNVVIADLNEEKGKEMANKLNAGNQGNKAEFISTNVSDPQSVENLVNQTVLKFGGLDVMISNAGILRAGGLEEMTPDSFKLMTDINYTGFFYCAKYASKIMKIQSQYKPDFFFDILQINSKSGLQGSKKNFAYAGGKFGGVGLTQSFALELMEFNIKVNSICPGNFFDGPLWADPQNGLFVQYLKAGKVPGAKTIEDVKRHYENQVPAGRGCRVIDVARAIFYSIEQEYETGQAIPVTGGQIMLK